MVPLSGTFPSLALQKPVTKGSLVWKLLNALSVVGLAAHGRAI